LYIKKIDQTKGREGRQESRKERKLNSKSVP
jgi:hypothetical protein